MRAFGIVTVLCLSLCAGAEAEEDKHAPGWQLGPALEAFDNYDGPKMSGEHLKRCEQLDYDGIQAEKRLKARKGALAGVERQLDRANADLDRRKATLDNRDGAAVDAYNRVIAEQQRLVDEYNAKLPAFNEAVAEYNALIEPFNEECVGRAYINRHWFELRLARDRE